MRCHLRLLGAPGLRQVELQVVQITDHATEDHPDGQFRTTTEIVASVVSRVNRALLAQFLRCSTVDNGKERRWRRKTFPELPATRQNWTRSRRLKWRSGFRR